MNLDSLNKWLTLIANVGVLAGIIFVGVELSQTQVAMNAQSSSTRAELSIENRRFFFENQIYEVNSKLSQNEDVSVHEFQAVGAWITTMFRQFENLHYQQELGVLDEDIWVSNLTGLAQICNSAAFRLIFPNWPENPVSGRFRKSFSDLVQENCY